MNLVISCFLLAEATATSSGTIATGSIVAASVSSMDAIHSISSAGFDINVLSEEDEEGQENSPVLASVVAEHEEREDEEESPSAAKESLADSTKTVDENVFASAGLVYNQDKGIVFFFFKKK